MTASTGKPPAASAEPANSQFPKWALTTTTPRPSSKADWKESRPSHSTSLRRTSSRPPRMSAASPSASPPTCSKQAFAVKRTHSSPFSGNALAIWVSTTSRRQPALYANRPNRRPRFSLSAGGVRPSTPNAERVIADSRKWRSRFSGPSLPHGPLRRQRCGTASRTADDKLRPVPSGPRDGRTRRYGPHPER